MPGVLSTDTAAVAAGKGSRKLMTFDLRVVCIWVMGRICAFVYRAYDGLTAGRALGVVMCLG